MDNRGVTLIELIVVMIIIAVLAGGAVIGVGSLDSGNARSCVNQLNALLDYVRIQNMSKSEAYYLMINENDGGFTVTVQSRVANGSEITSKDVLSERLKLKHGKITYYTKDSATGSVETPHEISSEEFPVVSLEAGFLKESGAVRAQADGSYVTKIKVETSGRSYTIILVTATGKHYIDD